VGTDVPIWTTERTQSNTPPSSKESRGTRKKEEGTPISETVREKKAVVAKGQAVAVKKWIVVLKGQVVVVGKDVDVETLAAEMKRIDMKVRKTFVGGEMVATETEVVLAK